ncbi:MAG TPA: lysoplasmalogenase [Turneriella sp.]|nr:lysoplasmalogenase [Turneriella sp.]
MEVRLLIFVSLVLTAVLAKFFWRQGYVFLKLLPLLFIITHAFLFSPRVDILWFAAISLGLAGDVLLLKEKWFVPGLLSFLLGHIFYIFAFNHESQQGFQPTLVLFWVALFIIAVCGYFTRHLIQSRQKKYILPVILYVLVSGAFFASTLHNPLRSTAVLGAFLFCFSDFLLGFHKFVRPMWYVQALVSLTYFAGQWLLAHHFGYVR